jgi:hypothetical protein
LNGAVKGMSKEESRGGGTEGGAGHEMKEAAIAASCQQPALFQIVEELRGQRRGVERDMDRGMDRGSGSMVGDASLYRFCYRYVHWWMRRRASLRNLGSLVPKQSIEFIERRRRRGLMAGLSGGYMGGYTAGYAAEGVTAVNEASNETFNYHTSSSSSSSSCSAFSSSSSSSSQSTSKRGAPAATATGGESRLYGRGGSKGLKGLKGAEDNAAVMLRKQLIKRYSAKIALWEAVSLGDAMLLRRSLQLIVETGGDVLAALLDTVPPCPTLLMVVTAAPNDLTYMDTNTTGLDMADIIQSFEHGVEATPMMEVGDVYMRGNVVQVAVRLSESDAETETDRDHRSDITNILLDAAVSALFGPATDELYVEVVC